MARIFFTAAYESRLSEIEDFIFASTQSLGALAQFHNEHDQALSVLAANPNAGAIHPKTGDQSWVFADGRYRVFYKPIDVSKQETTLLLIHIIDNRQANLDIYPNNSMPTFDEDE